MGGEVFRPEFRVQGHAGGWGGASRRCWRAKDSNPPPNAPLADLVVLNTCTVTSSADEDVRHAIRRVRRENPAARILVTGCYAQRAPEELAALPGVDWVVGNSHKTEIAELVTLAADSPHYHGNIHVGDIFAQRDFLSAPVEDAAGDRTRPNLKIQDGCNNRCSFCVIPFVRGRSRGMPAERVVEPCAGIGGALSRNRAERHQSRPLGQGTGAAPCAWRTWCVCCCPKPRWSGCA